MARIERGARGAFEARLGGKGLVLDPFCGTGTTALACAERGIPAITTDINPFLIWLAKAKSRRYSLASLERFDVLSRRVQREITVRAGKVSRGAGKARRTAHWRPDLYQIEKWWEAGVLEVLAQAWHLIRVKLADEARPVRDLLELVFCQVMIASAQVSFGHQSMSFRRGKAGSPPALDELFRLSAERISRGATSPIARLPRVLRCDARELATRLEPSSVAQVITSPPYPNRMSYVRELRPYMYWLGYLADGRAAGELDWSAIGGTWGTATSRVGRWEPAAEDRAPSRSLTPALRAIARRSELLSRYVHKYFCDMFRHLEGLGPLLQPNATLHYIVGNSKFYDAVLPVERIFAELFANLGWDDVTVTTLRKRSSKRELFEFEVSARKPA
ncbi:MAG TPA: DNA methyltransferase [Polyangiaceae bacterium]|nr:DNA methyltransferase [Polyangiaceae bacterium]